jgi:hypothetical protein
MDIVQLTPIERDHIPSRDWALHDDSRAHHAAGEYRGLKRLSLQSTQITKALTDTAIAPILEATAQLVGAVT